MIGRESEPLSLKSEYTLICKHTFNTFIMMHAFASRKSKRGELIVKREQEIAVKDLLLGKNVLAVLPTGYGKSLIFTLLLLARENITRIDTDGRIVFLSNAPGISPPL